MTNIRKSNGSIDMNWYNSTTWLDAQFSILNSQFATLGATEDSRESKKARKEREDKEKGYDEVKTWIK